MNILSNSLSFSSVHSASLPSLIVNYRRPNLSGCCS